MIVRSRTAITSIQYGFATIVQRLSKRASDYNRYVIIRRVQGIRQLTE
jgi:hypothetical protein